MSKPWDPRVKPSVATAASKPGKRLDATLVAAACVVVMLTAPLVGANPTGGQVVRGNAAITTGPKQVTVDQHSGKAIIEWNGFSIDPGEVTQFNQPGKRAIALNRVVTTAEPSRIRGQLKANGNVWLINQNGVTIGRNGKVQAQGFLATTADIADDNFMRGRYQFDRPSANHDAKVVNQGHISIKERGLGALVAPHARNDGVITGQGSTVVIAGAKTFAVDLYGDGLINFETGSPVTHKPEGVESLAANHGIIEAEGGQVLITAAAAEGIVDQAIRVGGKIHARSAYTDGGEIVLDGGDHGTVAVTGTLDASSGSGRGGKIDIRGHRIRVGHKSLVKASGNAGGGDIRIGGDQSGQGPGPNADAVVLAAEARIIADATHAGDGGSIIVYGTETARIDGTLMARGGPHGGDGGFIETSAVGTIDIESAQVDASAPAGKPGTWLIDPQDITINIAKAGNIVTALEGGTNVEVKTDGTSNPDYGTVTDPDGAGNITVAADIQPDLAGSGEVTLTLTADNDVTINPGKTIGPASAAAGDSMGVTITAGNDITNNGTIDVSAGAGGVVSLEAKNGLLTIAGGITGGGVTLIGGTGIEHTAAGDITSTGTITATADPTGDILMSSGTLYSAGGDVTLAAGNNVDLGRIEAGNNAIIKVTATTGLIRDNTPALEGPGNENLVGGAIDLEAGQGIGGATADPGADIDITATSLDATVTGRAGGIFIAETDDLELGRIVAGGGVGEITIKAGSAETAGSITDKSPGDDSQENLVGGAISLTAVGGAIGGSGNADIDTQASSLDANAGGGIDIDNTLGSPVTVSSLTSSGSGDIRFDQSGSGAVAFGTVTTNDGGVTLTNANADLSVTGPIEAGGDGKNLTLTTTGSGDITLGGTTTATGDEVRITSAGAINGSGKLTATTADLDAAGGIGSTTTALALAAAKISADTADGGIDIANTLGSPVTVSSLISGGSGDIRFGQSGSGAVAFGTVTTNDGAVTLTNANADLSVTGPIEAGGDGKNLTLTTTGSGDITLSGTTTATDDEVRITSAGAIDGTESVTANTADLKAATGIGSTTTALALAAAKINADTADGGIDIANTLTTNTTVTSLASTNATGSASGNIRFDQSGGGAVAFGTVTTNDGGVTLTNANADLSVTGPVEAGGSGKNLTLTTTGSGDITLSGTTTATDDEVRITSAGAINGAGLVTAATVDLNATGDIGDTTALELAAASISADTTGGGIDIANTLTTNTTVTSLASTNATGSANGNIRFDQSGGGAVAFGTVTTNDGGVTLTNANADLSVTGPIEAGGDGKDLTLTTTGSGDITLSGTTTATDDEVQITSAGAINGAGLVTAATVDLNATGDIGDTTALELAAASISADTTGGGIDIANTLTTNTTVTSLASTNATGSANGNIRFDQSGGGTVTFGTVTTNDGGVTLTNANADLSVTGPIEAGGDGKNLTLTTTGSGDITLSGTTTATDDEVRITSAGAINGSGKLTATTADLDAAGGIGSTTTALALAAAKISADTAGGGVDLDNTLTTATTVTSLTSTNATGSASGNIRFDQSGGGAVAFGTVTTNDGGVTLTNANADLSVTGPIEAGGDGKDLTLTTTGSGDITLSGTTTATDDEVRITSAGAINGSGKLTATTADLDAAGGIGNTTALELAAASISADTTDGSIDIDNTLTTNTAVTSLTSTNATGSANGNIRFDQSGGGAVAFGTVTTNDGGVTLTNANADLGVTGPITAGGAGNAVALDAAGLLHIAAAVSGSSVDLKGGTGIAHTAAGDVTSGGTITAKATTGDLSMADGTVYSAGGAVDLRAADNVNLGRIEAGANTISVTATGGKISDITEAEGAGNENLVGREIILRAGSGIGAVGEATDIDTRMAGKIDAKITGPSGDVAIAETGAVRLGNTVLVTPGTGGSIQVSGSTMTIEQAVTTTGSGTIGLATTIGDLQVDRAVTAGGGLNLDAAGLLNVAAAVGGSRVELTGGTGIAHTGDKDVTSGGTITATAKSGDIGMADGTVYDADGAVNLTAANDVNLGRVNADGNAISVTATGGKISDITGAENENLVGGAITLQAAGGIGEPGGAADIDTAVTSIDAQTATGGIFIDETDAVTLDTVTTRDGGGPIQVTAGGDMTVAQAVTTAGGGKIDLTTTAGNLQANAEVRAGGELDLNAAGLLSLAAAISGSTVELKGGTGIEHTATGDVISGGAITATATSGDIGMADGTVYDADGAVNLTAANDVNLGRVEAGSNAITVTADSDNTAGGAISDNTAVEGPGNENLVGGDVKLTAGGGIGKTGDADIDTKAVSIDAQTTSGGIFIAETDAVQLGNTGPVTTGSGGGDIAVTAGSTMTVAQAVTAVGGGAISLTTTAGELQVDQAVSAGGTLNLDAAGLLNIAAAAKGGSVVLSGGTGIGHTADGDVTSGGALTATTQAGDIGMADGTIYRAGGAVNLTAANDVNLGRVDAGDNTIRVTATGGKISDITEAEGAGNENLVGGAITLQAATGIGAPGSADIDTTVTSIDAQTTSGGIFIDETDAVTLGPVTTGSGGGTIDIISGGAMTIAQAVTTAGGGAISLTTTAGDLQVGQAVTAGGNLSLDAAGRLLIAAAIGGSSVELAGGAGIAHTGAGDVSSAGNLAIASANDIVMADGTRYSAGGTVDLTAQGNAALGRVEAAAISVTAATGAISDNTAAEGPGNENLVAGDLSLTAATGIGAPGGSGDIDTAAGRIDATTGAGGIYLTETDTVQLGNQAPLTAGGGPIEITAGGAMAVIRAVTTAGGGSIRLATANDLLVEAQVSAGGELSLDAIGRLIVAAAVSGSEVALAGGTGIAHTEAGDVSSAGALAVASADAIDMADGTRYSAAETVDLTAQGEVALGRVEAGTAISVTSTEGGIRDNTAAEGAGNENLVADDVSLAAADGVGEPGSDADIDTAADTIDAATGAGGIYLAETDAVQLGNQASVTTGAGGGAIEVTAGGAMTLARAVTTAGGGTIRLTTRAADLQVGDQVTAGGELSLDAAGRLIVAAAVSGSEVALAGGTGIAHTEAGDVTATRGAITAVAATGDIGMADGTHYQAAGNATLTAQGNVELGRIDAGGDAVTVTATAGAISDNTAAEGAGNENLVAGNLGLTAATGIGAPGGGADIDTAAATIDAETTRSGGIYLAETDAVTLAPTTGIRSAPAADIDITSGGEMVVGAGGVQTFASGDIRLTTTAGDLVVGGEVATDSGDLELTASGSIRRAAAGLLQAKGNNQGTPALRRAAGGLLRTRSDNQGTLALRSGQAIGTADAPILTDVATLAAAAADGGVFLTQIDDVQGNLTIGTTTGSNPLAGITAHDGDIEVTTEAFGSPRDYGRLDILGPIHVAGSGDIRLRTEGSQSDLVIHNIISTDNGIVELSAGRRVISDFDLSGFLIGHDSSIDSSLQLTRSLFENLAEAYAVPDYSVDDELDLAYLNSANEAIWGENKKRDDEEEEGEGEGEEE